MNKNLEDTIFITDDAEYLEPEIWGPKFWYVIEAVIISMNIHDADSIESTYMFMLSLKHVIPCPTCREHYQKFISKHDIQNAFSGKKRLFFWIFKLQNQIKKRNNKKPFKNFKEYLRLVKKKFSLSNDALKINNS